MKSKHLRTLFVTTLLSGAVSLVPNSAVLATGGAGSYGGGSRGGSVHFSGISTTQNTFQDALDSAMSAATITQSAASKDDWQLVAAKWQNAINLLKEVSASSPNYVTAQVKIQEYRTNLDYARKQLSLPPVSQPKEVAALASLPNTSTKPAFSQAMSQARAVATPVPHPGQVTPIPPTRVTPVLESDEFNYPVGAISLTVLIVIAGVGFYKAWILAKATIQLKSDGDSVVPVNKQTKQLSDQEIKSQTKDFSNQAVGKITDSNQEVIEGFTQAILLSPDAETYFRRGVAYESIGLYKEALKDFNQAICLNSAKAAYYSKRGIVRQKLGDMLGANWDLNTAEILSDPSKAKPYIQKPLPTQPKTMQVPDESENYYLKREFELPEFHLPEVVGRVASIALGLGGIIAFGLLSQKMGGGASGAVHVSSYRRSNGTFVRSHSRHRPR